MTNLSFTSPEPIRTRTKVELDGEDLWAVQPKSGPLLSLGWGVPEDEYEAATVYGFIDLAFEPASAERLKERLEDPDDWFDLDTLTNIIHGLQAAWSERPPTKPRGSSKRRTPTGRTSTATARTRARTPATSTSDDSATS